jgi:5-formyltetrahydrofolate cyclo-ligase
MESKTDLRRRLRARRREAYQVESTLWPWADSTSDVAARLPSFFPPELGLGGAAPGAGDLVAAYLSHRFEPPVLGLVAALLQAGRRVIVPAVGAGPGATSENIAWAEVPGPDWLDQLATAPEAMAQAGRPGRAPEPPGPRLDADVLAGAGAIIVPALALSLDGTRLGQGGGWYDRALGHARAGAVVIGHINRAELLAPGAIGRQSHDRPVTHALLPDGIKALGGRGVLTEE